MTAQLLTGTCAGVGSLGGALTRKVNANPTGHYASPTAGGLMGKGSVAVATHQLWPPHTIPTTPGAAFINPPYWPAKSGQGWPRGRRQPL